MEQITINTTKTKEIVDITGRINDLLKKHSAKDGLAHLFLAHTTAALTTIHLDPAMDMDLLGAYDVMVPSGSGGEHTHHAGHMPSHIIASLIGSSVLIPIKGQRLTLGDFQRAVLVELNGPKQRNIIVSFDRG